MYADILIPTDGSVGAERGIEHGVELADEIDADVHSLYVVDERVYGETPAMSAEELQFEQLEEEGREEVEEVEARAESRGLDAEGEVTRGVPSEAIADYADEVDADLIVMGIHGDDRVKSHKVGHVTNRVMRSVDTPVLPV